jgi:predicted metal-dependent enzyme (double-stranded beta helix superfamily)
MNAVYSVADFVRDAKTIVARGHGDQETMAALLEPLERAISRPDCLAGVEGSSADPDRGFSIYRSPKLSILAVVWAEGGGAPIHNHNGWALEGVILGKERNRNYQRLDDASEPWRAKLEEVDPSVVGPGQTTSLALPPNDIHAVEIPSGKTLAIHVYGIDLARQWRYQFDIESGEVKPYRMASRR